MPRVRHPAWLCVESDLMRHRIHTITNTITTWANSSLVWLMGGHDATVVGRVRVVAALHQLERRFLVSGANSGLHYNENKNKHMSHAKQTEPHRPVTRNSARETAALTDVGGASVTWCSQTCHSAGTTEVSLS
jgi:hypothetical protein